MRIGWFTDVPPVVSYTQLRRELSRYILMGNILDESYV